MADADTSSYQNKVLPLNPLDAFNKAATLRGQLNQNKLFQQQFQTKQALSRIYKEAIKPDGTLDFEKLRTLQASDPSVSYGLPEAYQGSQEAQQRNIGIDTSQLENAQKHLEKLTGYLAPLMKQGATSTDVASALAHAKVNGIATDKEALDVWLSLPRDQSGNVIEAQIPNWAQNNQMRVLSAQEQLNAMHPAPQMQQLPGGGTAPFVLPQQGNVQQVGPTIQAAPPPTTTVVGPDGTPRYVGAPQGNNPYERQFQTQQGQAPQQAQGGAASGGGIGGMAAGMSPAAQAASQGQGQFSVGQGNTLQGRADRVQENKAILGNLEGELSSFTTGPGTDTAAKFVKFVNANVPGANFVPKDLASREQFNKLAGMLAQSQFQALGGTGTDAKLDATTLTSPNSELSKLGNKGIIAMLKGNEDAISAKNQAWQAWQAQNGPQSYGQFQTQFNKSYDPRVFQSQYLDDADKVKMLKGMTQQEKNQLHGAFVTARKNGWVK